MFLSGNFVYTISAQQGGIAMANGLAEALNAPRPEAPVNFNVRRLDPATGELMWDVYRDDAPREVGFQKNWFFLRFDYELQAWKFLTF